MGLYLPQEDLGEYQNQRPVKLQGKISWQRVEDDKYVCGVAFENMAGDVAARMRESFKYYNKQAEFGDSR
jgi:hypothetical protein